MAKPVKQTQTKSVAARQATRRVSSKSIARKKINWIFPLNKQNFILAAIGLGVIILGYILMATGITEQPAVTDGKWNNVFAVSIAPILLLIGYCVIIPLAIMKLNGKPKEDTEESKSLF